jgi:predicted RNA-binding protein with PIN domain
LHYIIDGYNLFFTLQDVDPSLENRELFVQYISSLMKNKHLSGEMIFDTPIHHSSSYPHSKQDPPLTIVLAPTHLEADDLILEKLYAIKQIKTVTVITSDRALQRAIKELDVVVIDSSSFFSMLTKRDRKSESFKKPSSSSIKEHVRLQEIFEKKLLEEGD